MKVEYIIKEYNEGRNNIIDETKQSQLKRMYEEGRIELNENKPSIRFDNGEIDLNLSIYLDNFIRDLEVKKMREEITEEEYDEIIEIIG